MANGSSRMIPALVTLVLGFGIGWLVNRPAPQPPADDQLIRVFANGNVSKPKVQMGNENIAAWISEGGANLEILFPQKRFPDGITEPPFENMTPRTTPQGTDWAVRCGGDTCHSGRVNQKLPKGKPLTYKYDQVVAGQRTDGMIIIER